MMVQQAMTQAEWAQGGGGLCNCFSDWEVCFWGTFFLPCLYGQVKARSGRATDCYAGCCELTAVIVVSIIVSQVFAVVTGLNAIEDVLHPTVRTGSDLATHSLMMQLPGLIEMAIVYVS
eukprot:SAG22_NODE_2320_length_2722_cov_2.494472_3_plen_119_part_00